MKKSYIYIGICMGLIIIYFLSNVFYFRMDITSDKKYTLSDYTRKLLNELPDNVQVIIYLDGSLDSDYLRLKKAAVELLDEFNARSSRKIAYSFHNPNQAKNEEERKNRRLQLLNRGITDEILVETDNEGRITQKSVFPWADVILGKDTVSVCLLSEYARESNRERINASIEDLEYRLTEALTDLTETEVPEIAFLEGRGELPEIYVYDAVEALSKRYSVFRGSIAEIDEIPPYKALIIAGPTQKFSEKEKYLLDRYLVSGGSIFILMTGAVVSYEDLRQSGKSASMVNDVNLADLFFRYGFRINPVLLQDVQSVSIPLKVGDDNQTFHSAPWYFAPALNPSGNHPITRNSAPVKAEFVSSIDFTGDNADIKKFVLLTTSARTHVVSVPEMISPDAARVKETAEYFNQSNIPTAVLLEGLFPSAFENRFPPDGVRFRDKPTAKPGKIIVAGSANIIRNEIRWSNNTGTALPLGYDSYMDRQFGNRDFVVNSVNYLSGNESRIFLRNKHNTLRLLDKTKINSEKNFWSMTNIGIPILILIVAMSGFRFWRKRKYG